MLQPLPTTTHTFRKIIQGGLLYIDKTRSIYELIRYPAGVYFLSRPRRFGKSLLISILAEIFQGNRVLFKGLWIDQSDYDWQPYAVVRLDFSRHRIRSVVELETSVREQLNRIAADNKLSLKEASFDLQLEDLIIQLSKRSPVVILIDEYDKPITDNLADLVLAREIRDTLRSFYAVIKSLDEYLRFVFITGISKFSRVGIFSTMNNLEDITTLPDYATLLGITEEELQHYLADHTVAFAQKQGNSPAAILAQIKQWYDGFRFAADSPNVYNPYSTLLCFKQQRFSNFWFETGTPTFLINLLKKEEYDIQELAHLQVPEIAFSSYELDKLPILPLLFQTGYLTIKGYDPAERIYTLAYPNVEVEEAFMSYLLGAFSKVDRSMGEAYLQQLLSALKEKSLDRFFDVLKIFFANIHYKLYLKQEKYYQTIFYLIFMLLGARVTTEIETNRGRIDAVVELSDIIYIFEFKLNGSAEEALKQIKDQEYYQKYRLKGKEILLIGANFSSKQRQVAEWKSATP